MKVYSPALIRCSPGLGTQALCKPFSQFLTTSLASMEFQTTFSCKWWQSKWMGEATYGIWRWLLRYKYRTEKDAEEREMMTQFSYFVLSFAISKKPDIQKSELKSNTSGCDYSYYQHKGYFSLKRIHGKMPIAYFFYLKKSNCILYTTNRQC